MLADLENSKYSHFFYSPTSRALDSGSITKRMFKCPPRQTGLQWQCTVYSTDSFLVSNTAHSPSRHRLHLADREFVLNMSEMIRVELKPWQLQVLHFSASQAHNKEHSVSAQNCFLIEEAIHTTHNIHITKIYRS